MKGGGAWPFMLQLFVQINKEHLSFTFCFLLSVLMEFWAS